MNCRSGAASIGLGSHHNRRRNFGVEHGYCGGYKLTERRLNCYRFVFDQGGGSNRTISLQCVLHEFPRNYWKDETKGHAVSLEYSHHEKHGYSKYNDYACDIMGLDVACHCGLWYRPPSLLRVEPISVNIQQTCDILYLSNSLFGLDNVYFDSYETFALFFRHGPRTRLFPFLDLSIRSVMTQAVYLPISMIIVLLNGSAAFHAFQ